MDSIVQALADALRAASKDIVVPILLSLLVLIHEIGHKHGLKLLDNYNHRTLQLHTHLKAIWPDVVLNTKRTGEDAFTATLKDIEIKTYNIQEVKKPLESQFMWDKQNDENRRPKTLASDAFVFGVFVLERFRIALVAQSPQTLDLLRTRLKEKQDTFLKAWEQKHAEGKRGHDAIKISFTELLEGAEVPWDLCIDGQWVRNALSTEVKNRLTSFYTDMKKN